MVWVCNSFLGHGMMMAVCPGRGQRKGQSGRLIDWPRGGDNLSWARHNRGRNGCWGIHIPGRGESCEMSCPVWDILTHCVLCFVKTWRREASALIPHPLSLWEADSQIQGHLGAVGRHEVKPLPSRALLPPGLQLPGSLWPGMEWSASRRHLCRSPALAPAPGQASSPPNDGSCPASFRAVVCSLLTRRLPEAGLSCLLPSSCLHVSLDVGCLLRVPSQRAHTDRNLPWRAASPLARTLEEWRLGISVTLPPAPNTSAAQTVTLPSANKQEGHSVSKPKPK